MQRLSALTIILWLGVLGMAQAQTSPSTTTPAGTTASGSAAGTTAPGSSASTTGPAVASQPTASGTSLHDTPCSSTSLPAGDTGTGCGSDPLNVPASTIPTTLPIPQPGSANGETTGSTVGASASPSINPQRATQLPGEGSNASTQGPHTTAASAPSVSGSTPCTTSVPTTAGGAGMTGVFGGASGSGC
jgi:hypothetical protein